MELRYVLRVLWHRLHVDLYPFKLGNGLSYRGQPLAENVVGQTAEQTDHKLHKVTSPKKPLSLITEMRLAKLG